MKTSQLVKVQLSIWPRFQADFRLKFGIYWSKKMKFSVQNTIIGRLYHIQ